MADGVDTEGVDADLASWLATVAGNRSATGAAAETSEAGTVLATGRSIRLELIEADASIRPGDLGSSTDGRSTRTGQRP